MKQSALWDYSWSSRILFPPASSGPGRHRQPQIPPITHHHGVKRGECHTHRGPRARAQNNPGPRQQTDSGWVLGEKGVRARRGPQLPAHPHSLRQSWWMNKGPGCDSVPSRPHPTFRQMLWAEGVRQGAAWKRVRADLSPSGDDHSPHTEEQHKSRAFLSDKVWGGSRRRWAPARSVHRCSVFSKHTERRGGEDYSYPHDDGLKNRPFIHHQSTITQCTHHFHAVILMVSSTWLHGVHVHRHLSKCSILLICVINRSCTTSFINFYSPCPCILSCIFC